MSLCNVGDGVLLNVVERGAGRPIVFLHGWSTNSNVWQGQLDALSGEHHVLALDFRGFGDSPPGGSPTTAQMAADVKRLLDARRLEDVFLIGWSMGGLVTMSYCEQFGAHRLRAIGIVDVSPRLRPAEDWPLGVGVGLEVGSGIDGWEQAWATDPHAVYRALNTTGFADPSKRTAEIEWLMGESVKSDENTAMKVLVDLFDSDFRQSLSRIDVPALLMWGAHSTSTTLTCGRFVADAIPEASLVVFEQSGHAIAMEEPEKLNRVIDEFAKSV